MRVDDELLRGALVEVFVALRRLIELDNGDIDRFRDLDLAKENGVHQLAIVFHYRALARGEDVRFRPAETDANAKVPDLGIGVNSAGIARHIKAWNTESTTGARDLHQGVQHRGRRLMRGVLAVPASFKADAVHGAIHFRHSNDLRDLFRDSGAL